MEDKKYVKLPFQFSLPGGEKLTLSPGGRKKGPKKGKGGRKKRKRKRGRKKGAKKGKREWWKKKGKGKREEMGSWKQAR